MPSIVGNMIDEIFPGITLIFKLTGFSSNPRVPLLSATVCIAALHASPVAATPDIEAIVPAGTWSERCDVNQEWTLNYLANVLYLDVVKLARVKLVRGLSNFDICTMPESRLQRAVVKAAEPKPDHPGEAASFRERQRWGSDGKADPMGLSNAIAAREAMLAAESSAQITGTAGAIEPQDAGINSAAWTAIGPGNIGGRIRALATVPGSPLTLFAGSIGGGIWKTLDGGATWNPVNSFGATLSVSSIVINPLDSSIMYAATGEGFYNADAIRGAGIYKTTNGGSSWFRLAAASPSAGSDWYYVNRLSIHPTNPLILLAATDGGVYRTVNGGTSWTKVSFARVLDVKFDPSNPTRAAAGRSDGRIERSSDSGATFFTVLVPAAATDPGGFSWGRVEIAWARSTGRLYAGVQTKGSKTQDGRIFTSSDGGASWTARATPFHLAGQGWYNNAIWVDPTNENLLLIGGLDNHRSTDGGLTFSKVSQWYCAPLHAHADNHAIVEASDFNASTIRAVYWGNDGGIYKAASVDALLSQTDPNSCPVSGWTSLNNGFSVTQFYGVGVSSAGAGAVYGGTQDNGSLKWSGAGTNWTTVFGGDGGASAADPVDANYLYGEYVYLNLHRSTNGTQANATASYIYNGITDADLANPQANFIAPFVLDPNNSSRLYGGAKRLWVSNTVKATTPGWAIARAQAANRDNTVTTDSYWTYISAIAVASGNADIMYVGHNDARVFKTINATAATPTWTELTCASPVYPVFFRQVLRLVVDPANSNIVYVGHGGYDTANLWKLDSTGATTCTGVGSGLPPSPVRGIARHPTATTWLYAGTEVGLFASENLGTTWKAATDGPANVSVEDLAWQNGNTLVAATHGRGMFKAVVGTTPSCAFSLTPVPVAASASASTVSIDVSSTLASCAWTASSAAGWVSPAVGNGSGSARLNLNITANTGAPRATSITVAGTSVLVEQEGTPLSCSLDLDGDTLFTPSIDGMLLLRYSLGFRGTGLTQGLGISTSALRQSASAIVSYIETPGRNFDIDGDGAVTATDALLALRALQGLTGAPATVGALSAARTRSPAQIQTILSQCLR